MVLPAGDPVPQDTLIHPRIEPEIVFVMGERLEGPGVTGAQAMAAVDDVLGGVEVIDSPLPRLQVRRRRRGRRQRVLGRRSCTGPIGCRPDELDLATRGASWSRSTARSSTRRPARPSRATRARRSRWPPTTWPGAACAIEAGWIVLTGGMTDAVFAPPGSQVALHFTNLGSVFVNGGEPAAVQRAPDAAHRGAR